MTNSAKVMYPGGRITHPCLSRWRKEKGGGATIEAGITLRPHLKMTKVIGNRICKDCLTEDNASYNNGRGAIVNFVRGSLMQQNQVREQILSLGAKSTKLKKSIFTSSTALVEHFKLGATQDSSCALNLW